MQHSVIESGFVIVETGKVNFIGLNAGRYLLTQEAVMRKVEVIRLSINDIATRYKRMFVRQKKCSGKYIEATNATVMYHHVNRLTLKQNR